jgi:hypothetical protein
VSRSIRFDRTKFDSKGRNGYIGTTGINVVDLGEELFLEPITTRGLNSEACRIVLPKSAITALVDALAEIASRTCQRGPSALQLQRLETATAIPSTGATKCPATS